MENRRISFASKERFMESFLSNYKTIDVISYPKLIRGLVEKKYFSCAIYLIVMLELKGELPEDYKVLKKTLITHVKSEYKPKNVKEKKTFFSLLKSSEANNLTVLAQLIYGNFIADDELMNYLGITLQKKFNLTKALLHYRICYLIFPDNKHIVENFAIILEKSGEFNEAGRVLEKLYLENINSINVLVLLANFKIRQNLFTEAQSLLEAKLDSGILGSSYYNALGDCYVCVGDVKSAMRSFRAALENNKNDIKARKSLGHCLWDLNRNIEAYDVFMEGDRNINRTSLVEAAIKFLHAFEDISIFPGKLPLFDKKIRQLFLDTFISRKKITKLNIKDFATSVSELMNTISFPIETKDLQIYSGRFSDLDCRRYKSLFFNYNAISSNCFSCFKLEVGFEDVISLIQGMIQLKLDTSLGDFISKSIVDSRPNVTGRFKSIIYCQSLTELDFLHDKLSEYGYGVLKKRRGCTEFTNAYPDFQISDNVIKGYLKQPPEWRQKEKLFDAKQWPSDKQRVAQKRNFHDFTIYEAAIMLHWFNCDAVEL